MRHTKPLFIGLGLTLSLVLGACAEAPRSATLPAQYDTAIETYLHGSTHDVAMALSISDHDAREVIRNALTDLEHKYVRQR